MSSSSSSSDEVFLDEVGEVPPYVAQPPTRTWNGQLVLLSRQQATRRLGRYGVWQPGYFLLTGHKGNGRLAHARLRRCRCAEKCDLKCVSARTADLLLINELSAFRVAPTLLDVFLVPAFTGNDSDPTSRVDVVIAALPLVRLETLFKDPGDIVKSIIDATFVLHYEAGYANRCIVPHSVMGNALTKRAVFTDWSQVVRVKDEPEALLNDREDAIRVCKDKLAAAGEFDHPVMMLQESGGAVFDAFVG